jgi:hypothetical protein
MRQVKPKGEKGIGGLPGCACFLPGVGSLLRCTRCTLKRASKESTSDIYRDERFGDRLRWHQQSARRRCI